MSGSSGPFREYPVEPFILSSSRRLDYAADVADWVCGTLLAWFRGRAWLEAAVALPLVLPPPCSAITCCAFSPVGGRCFFCRHFGQALAFSFPGLVVASMVFNLPFAVQPMQQAFAAIPHEVREAAGGGLTGEPFALWSCRWRPGVLGAAVPPLLIP